MGMKEINERIKALNHKELLEDLEYFINVAQFMAPPFLDTTFDILRRLMSEINKRVYFSKKDVADRLNKIIEGNEYSDKLWLEEEIEDYIKELIEDES